MAAGFRVFVLLISLIKFTLSLRLLSSVQRSSFDPFHFSDSYKLPPETFPRFSSIDVNRDRDAVRRNYALASSIVLVTNFAELANAEDIVLQDIFDPSKFQPVCPTSDGVYQVLKASANAVVGKENVVEYGPLIASLLLRIRLEICVLESFIYEAVVPFVQQKGLSWILPLHESLETFFAGTIFAIACNIILLGSTKIVSVLFIFFDAIIGFPARIIGGLIKKLTPPSSPGNIAGTGLQTYGDVSDFIRRSLESIDTFVGRYLVVITTAYVLFKLLHFKLFNDLF